MITEPMIDNDVINHLLFHKSLIDEQDDASRINYYVDVLQKTNEGSYLSMDNPFERSIAIAFELVMNQQLNPWDLDLVSFSTLYMKRAKEEDIDLITAGRIIHMAWKVLRLQSDDLVVSLQEPEELDDDLGWDDMSSEMWLTAGDEYSYTNLLMNLPEPPLEEPVRRDAKRKVTLIELLDAFEQARHDADHHQHYEMLRKEEQRRLKIASRKRMIGTAHEDNLEQDITEIWKKIRNMDKKQMTLKDLCTDTSRETMIKTLISILFLAYENKVKVFQRKFPYGKIFIKTMGYT